MQTKEPQLRTGFLPALAAPVWHHHPSARGGDYISSRDIRATGVFSVSLDELLEFCLDRLLKGFNRARGFMLESPLGRAY